MKKIESIQKGRIWLNVFKTDDGQILTTINKTYMNDNGNWVQTPFLNPRRGDVLDLMDCLNKFLEFKKVVKAEGG